jgi:hypothetical protein
MESSCFGVGSIPEAPITRPRTAPCPTYAAALVPIPCVFHVSNVLPTSMPPPSLLVMTVVTPCIRYATFPFRCALERSPLVCVCASMNPGATTRPVASIVRLPVTREVAAIPTKVTRSPVIPMSAMRAAAPVPSTTLPPRIRTSTCCCAVAGAESSASPSAYRANRIVMT